jgi:hypothetical protein
MSVTIRSMGLFVVSVWHLRCDFVEERRQCGDVWSGEAGTMDVAVDAARVAGWAVSRRPGYYEVRCPEHRRRHQRWVIGLSSQLDRGLSAANAGVARGSLRPDPKGRAEAAHSPALPRLGQRLDVAGGASAPPLHGTRPSAGQGREQPSGDAGGGPGALARPRKPGASKVAARAKNQRRHGRPRGSGG